MFVTHLGEMQLLTLKEGGSSQAFIVDGLFPNFLVSHIHLYLLLGSTGNHSDEILLCCKENILHLNHNFQGLVAKAIVWVCFSCGYSLL